ncbi:putative sensor histidine kinase/response regulator [Aspergillus saccharolyticus JOP 1030-1]|uniref:Sensor histidine kinase/response regulator n=1 Tax=Aspergillus saccharolyticus JOP 1030-1 TaxID=1450539 RepID=A0A318ZSZ9_9EURO|nr:sensor histidine kinase/response regulator [Aspergillus saccharolyticus JOP 1030-1]PYH49825.1 sensor histidine kinase/response regulator [Aspergillus saccharolyticus JOP 1030-1]
MASSSASPAQNVEDDSRSDLAVNTHDGSSGSSPENPDLNRDTGVGGADRIYPIRSIVSVNPSPTSPSQAVVSTGSTQLRAGARSYSIIDSDTWDQLRAQPVFTPPSDTAISSSDNQFTPGSSEYPSLPTSEGHSRNSDAGIRVPAESDGSLLPVDKNKTHITSRFQHVMTNDGHAVVTGSTPDTFMACEDEPIHIPGAVQSFGVLLAMREDDDGILSVRVASENSEALLDHSPSELFALESFCDILHEDQADILLDHVDFVRDEAHDPSADGPEVFILSINDRNGRPRRFWCAIHVIPTQREIIICEFELEDDRINPLNSAGRSTPAMQTDTLGFDPTPEQLASSTVNISQPLRVLRNARRRRGEAAAMEVFSIVSQIQDQLGDAKTLDTLLNITVGLVKELTGFHRVMIYQFDSDYNGTVVAELVDMRTTKDLYKGLHFPAADIPKQARELYRINKVRLLYDRDQLTSRLVCRSLEDLKTPLDLTHAHLRAMSPIHIRYLANMGVRSSMSISINSPNDLWGLISCHTHGDVAMRVPFPIRKMCRLIGDTLSRNIERLSYTSRLQARKLINTIPTDANPSGYIIASSDDMLRLFDADYGAISIRGETKILGKSNESSEMLALLEFLKMRQLHSVVASHHVTKDFPDLHYPPGFKHISGMLYVPLSSDGKDFIVFFRRGQLTEIKWGGNPHEKEFKNGHLEPRKSFQVWSETVIDQAREWSESEVETAAVLCLVYGKFIKVWRQQEAALEGSQLTKLLLANSAHEVRTPLNAIINYLEIALEGVLDTETRDNLTKSYSASKSLIYVINDLLDLTNTEKGQNLIKDEAFDLPQVFKEANAMFEGEAKRKGIKFTVITHPGIPRTVLGDERRVRQAISNLIANAVQHTTEGEVTVELWRAPVTPEPGVVTVQMTVLDTGCGMSDTMLETLFQELEQVSYNDDDTYYFDRDPDNATQGTADGGEEKGVLGLGLALVSRIVRNTHGQLSVRSEEGKGSRFQISLQFATSSDEQPELEPVDVPAHTESPTPFQQKEEFVLVDNSSPTPSEGRRRSGDNSRAGGTEKAHPGQIPIESLKDKLAGVSIRELSKLSQTESADDGADSSQSDTKVPASPITQPSGIQITPQGDSQPKTPTGTYSILVAEDDPINSKIIQKRLGKAGHAVELTVNGEECAAAFRADPARYDLVLMDIQMPIVDGINSTKMIRQVETEPNCALSPIAQANQQIPIFAVSASLLEKDMPLYVGAGFDGWIMKPINFNRLNVLLYGLEDEKTRRNATYRPGEWENGGWFPSL